MSLRQRYGTAGALAIVLALIVKVLILYGLWYTFISPHHTRHIPQRTSEVGSNPTPPAASAPSQLR